MTPRVLWWCTALEIALVLPAIWIAEAEFSILSMEGRNALATAIVGAAAIAIPASCLGAPALAWQAFMRERPWLAWGLLTLPFLMTVLFWASAHLY